MRLDGKHVLITGAKGGLGDFVTRSFLDAGAQVFGVARSISAKDFPSDRFNAIHADLTDPEAVASLVENVLKLHGPLDALVHLVGAFAGGQTVDQTEEATLERMMNLNFRSAFLMIRAVLPGMRERSSGRILAIGSQAAVEPAPIAGVYAASKAALVSLIRTVARETAESGVTANIVLPGTMDTPANRAANPGAETSKWVDPHQVAQLLVHLASDAASHVSGAVIPVYGASA